MMRFAMLFGIVSLLLPCTSIWAAGTPEPATPLPLGATMLTDLGFCRMFWQSYGKDPVEMNLPSGGGSDPTSGATFSDTGRAENRAVITQHSPWLVPPGKIWGSYRLALPQSSAIRLSFGIAMPSANLGPGKSDGVTFSCYVTEDGARPRELMRQHYASRVWKDYSFDLTPYAGKSVELRFQTEPGPQNNTAYDSAWFGDPKIVIGDAQKAGGELVQKLVATRAYQAAAKGNLERLSNASQNGVVPSNLLPCKNSVEQAGDAWRFIYEGEDGRLVYVLKPKTGTLDDFTVQMDNNPTFQPAAGGGAWATVQQNGKPQEVALRGGKAASIARDADGLRVVWQYDLQGKPVEIQWTYRILGKALAVSARCERPVVSRFSLGATGSVALRRKVGVPYLLGSLNYLPGMALYVGRYLDWTVSHSSMCPHDTAMYETKTDGTRNPMVEAGYVSVSPDVDEVLPNLPSPASPFLAALGPRIMLDIWGHCKNTYVGDAEKLRELKDNGVDHVAIISHVWQRYGYDAKLPDHLPANPDFGGDPGMIEFGKAANECGYLWSLHENYIDLYPDAPSYDPTARVQLADGSPSKAWYNESTKVQSYGLKCNRALEFAKKNSPEIHRRFGTTAGYLDVHPCVPPWHQLDHEANQPMAAEALAKVKYDTELFQFMRDTHGGPLFGEGCNHFYWAGRCDGVEAQVNGGEDHEAFLDFDLLKIHPQMVNHGMGYYERWYRRSYDLIWGVDAGSMAQFDKYRAQQVAYGHAGFVGGVQAENVQFIVREHHLTHPVQRLYGTSKPVEIRYEVAGQMVTASVALAVGDTTRQRIRYQSGLTVWVNWCNEPWAVEGRTLPQWGFLALGPDTDVSTALRDGRWADYAACPEYVFADARTNFEAPYLRDVKDIEPRLASFKYLGGDRIQVTYEWIVNDTLDKDYVCFVHGCRPAYGFGDLIEFQQDHNTPKPTRQWQKGERLVDGPYEFQVANKADVYDLKIGLYGQNRRVTIKGPDSSSDSIVIARLVLERKDGKIVGIKSTPPEKQNKIEEADFKAHLNPAGTWVDFGAVATDGAVKINREKDYLTLFPYPRDKEFRVSLDLKALAPTADPAKVQVHALAAGTCQDLGVVESKLENNRLTIKLGKAGAGRYRISWK